MTGMRLTTFENLHKTQRGSPTTPMAPHPPLLWCERLMGVFLRHGVLRRIGWFNWHTSHVRQHSTNDCPPRQHAQRHDFLNKQVQ